MGGRLPARTSDIKRSMVPHRLRYQIFHCLAQQRFARVPRHAFAANLEHGRHRKRRDPVKRNMPDSSADPLQKAAQASDVDQAGCGVGEGSLEENMVGLMLAEHVVDQIGGDGHLPAGLLLPRMAALDQPRDDGTDAEGALHQARLGKPSIEIVAEHVLVEQSREVEPSALHHLAHIGEPPHAERIFIGDETERLGMGALEPARQQHAEALMGEPSLEWIADEIMPLPARKGLDQDLVGARHDRHLALNAQPVRDLIRKPRTMASVSRKPSKRSTSPANTKLSPGTSCSMKYSSTSPSTRPAARTAEGLSAPPWRRASRTRTMGASTMVPTFRRYCWASRGWAMR